MEVIKSIGYDQHEILYNIMQLHNDGKPFDCDMTYSIGAFYGDFKVKTGEKDENGAEIVKEFTIPQPQYKYDVAPSVDGVEKIDTKGQLPLEDGSIESLVIDLPFVISTGPSMEGPNFDEDGKRVKNNMISRRFASYYPVAQLLDSYKHWLTEAYRVLSNNGLLVFKTQATITGSKMLNTPYYSRMIAESLGFDSYDEFVLLARARLISGKIEKQQHARSFHSYFLVFRKSSAKHVMYFNHMSDNEIQEIFDGLKKNNTSKERNRNEVRFVEFDEKKSIEATNKMRKETKVTEIWRKYFAPGNHIGNMTDLFYILKPQTSKEFFDKYLEYAKTHDYEPVYQRGLSREELFALCVKYYEMGKNVVGSKFTYEEYAYDAYNHIIIQTFNSKFWEFSCKSYLEDSGFKISEPDGHTDGKYGIDMIAEKDGKKIGVQVKPISFFRGKNKDLIIDRDNLVYKNKKSFSDFGLKTVYCVYDTKDFGWVVNDNGKLCFRLNDLLEYQWDENESKLVGNAISKELPKKRSMFN